MNQINSTPIEGGVWKKLWSMFYQPQKALFHRVMLFAVVTAATESVFTLVTKAVVDEIVTHGAEAKLLRFAVIYLVLLLILVTCIRTFIKLAGLLSTELMYSLRKQSFEHLQELSFSFYDQHAVGWLVSRVTSDCARISRLVAWGTLDLFWGIPYLVGIFSVLFFLNVKLALLILALFPALAVVAYGFNWLILQSSRLVRRTNSRLTAVYNEGIAGIETSKVLVREQQNLAEFEQDSALMYSQSMTNLLLSSAFMPVVTLFISVGTGLALWLGGYEVIGGVITLGTLVAFISYSQTLQHPLLEVAQVLTNIQRTTASAERVLGLLAVEPGIADSEQVLEAMHRAQCRGATTIDGGDATIESIEFEQVSFAYKESEPVLKHFDLKVEAGQSIALVGATGSGKSTIVSLLCRFYEPVSGVIRINGVDYKNRSLSWLQSNLGIVLQTPFLFSGTIASNIRYGKLDASDDEVVAAAKAVNAHELIMDLEQGYQTEVREGGNNLSTGQKQLISFARAVIGNPQILVMDEATSSVDTETEHKLQEGIRQVLKGRTSFIIAHRLSTIRSADKILVIDQGELLEAGSHQQLIDARGAYYELYQKQFEHEQEEALLHDD